MRRLLLIAAATVAVALLAVSAGPTPRASGDGVPMIETIDPSLVLVDRAATRGSAIQQTPTLPEPPAWANAGLWQTGSVPGCVAGQYMRGVDTGGQKLVTFTFDDGPDPHNTKPIMDAFAQRGATATFFLIGRNLIAYPAVGRSIVERGFAVGNHSVTHQYRPSVIGAEVAPMNDIINDVLGIRTPYFRAPGLNVGPTIDAALTTAGMCNFSTDLDLHDYDSPRRSAATLCGSFSRGLHPGTIVLLHDGGSHSPTVAAVPCMLDIALARGYQIVSLQQMLVSGTPYEGRRPSVSSGQG